MEGRGNIVRLCMVVVSLLDHMHSDGVGTCLLHSRTANPEKHRAIWDVSKNIRVSKDGAIRCPRSIRVEQSYSIPTTTKSNHAK